MATYDIHGFVNFSTDFSLPLPDQFITDESIDVKVTVEVDPIEYNKTNRELFDNKYYWDPDNHSLIIDWGYKAKAEIVDLYGKTTIRVTDFFRKYGDLRELFWSIFQYKLLQSNATVLHAAGLRDPDGAGVIVQGWSNMGKTSTALLLAGQPETELYGDDTILIHDGNVYSYPRDIGLSPGTLVPDGILTKKERIRRTIQSKSQIIPLKDMLPFMPGSRMSIPPERFGVSYSKTDIDYCFFLQPNRDNPEINELSTSEATRRAVINSRFSGEGGHDFHHLVSAYCYLDERIDDRVVTERHNEIIRDTFRQVKSIELATKKSDYIDAITERTGWN